MDGQGQGINGPEQGTDVHGTTWMDKPWRWDISLPGYLYILIKVHISNGFTS